MNIAVFYHSHCLDGTMAAAAAQLAARKSENKYVLSPINYSQATSQEFFYGQRSPFRYAAKMLGNVDEVYFVDFCPKAEVLVALSNKVSKVVVLDHHKTAQEDLEGLKRPNLEVIFDMEKSGARLAWEYFHNEVPSLVAYVEDRDLWRFTLDKTRQVNLWLSTAASKNDPETFLWAVDQFDKFPGVVKESADVLYKLQENLVKEQATKWRKLDMDKFRNGAIVPAVNFASEVCEHVYDNNEVDWVMGFSFTKDGRVAISLRSKQERSSSVDVTEIARMFGGGGHKHASGCAMDLDVFTEIYQSSEIPQS